MRVALVLLLVLSALIAAPAEAQQACGPLDVTVTTPSSGLSSGERGQMTVSVANNGPTDASVRVSVSVTTPGWRVTPLEQGGGIQAGQGRGFVFDIDALDSAASDATVNFLATADCAPDQLDCPATAAQACTATTAATAGIALRADEGRGLALPPMEGAFPYVAGGLVLVGLAILLPAILRKRQEGVVATAPEPLKVVAPGKGATFPIEVRNRGLRDATARVEIPLPEGGWTATTAMPDVQLAPGEARTVLLVVRAPPDARPGDALTLAVRLAVEGAEAREVRVRAEVA